MTLISLRQAVEEVAAALLVATLLTLMVLSCTACASFSQLADTAAQVQREVDSVVKAHRALEKSCEEEQPTKSKVCEEAERAWRTVERLLARMPVEIPGDVEEVQP